MMSQRKDEKPNWDEVLEFVKVSKQAELCQGPTLSDETQGKSGSKKTPTEEKRARVAKSWLLGRTETVRSRNHRIGKSGQKKPF